MFKRYSKILGVLAIIIGGLIALTPRYIAQPCPSLLELKSGMMVHMVCYWTGQAATVIGILVLLVGVLQVIAKSGETTRYLGIVQALLGIALFFIPKSYVIGICGMGMAACHHMASTLTVLALVLFAISLVNIFWVRGLANS